MRPHPSLKPQAFLRELVLAALPTGAGVILDPFMGSGSTIAAAEALGLESMGVELHVPYFELATAAVPKLAAIIVRKPQGLSPAPLDAVNAGLIDPPLAPVVLNRKALS